MSRTPKTRNLIVATVLTATLALTPAALAGPAYGPADALGSVYAWLNSVWNSLTAIAVSASAQDEGSGPQVIPNGSKDEFGPFVIPNGSQDEFIGPLIIPNGQQSQAGDEYGGFVVPNGPPATVSSTEDDGPNDEFGPFVIPNG